MKFKYAFWGGVIVALIVLGIGYLFKDNSKPELPDTIKYEQVIDSLNKEIQVQRTVIDSLEASIHNSKARVDTIEKWYEKELASITNQSIASDVVFFTEYLSQVGK